MTFIVSTAAPAITQPGISLINVTPTSITVSLDTPATGPTPISFYSVQVFIAATGTLLESFSVQPTAFPFIISGLTNGTTYSITVTAIEATQNVYASPSILKQSTTGSTASPPPQVTGLTATATGQTTIVLNWSADSTATSYTITRTGGLSASGTTIPPASVIIDSSGNTWTLVAGVVDLNGAATVSSNVILVLYYNNVVYQENSSNLWWSWTGSWTSVPGDPRGTGTTVPSPAAAVGYNTNTFNSTTWNNTSGPWYSYSYFGNTEPAGSIVQNSDGSLSLGQNVSNNYGVATSYQNNSAPHKWSGLRFGGGAYFELTTTINCAAGFPNGSQPTAAWWANDENETGGYVGIIRWIEVDCFETNVNSQAKEGQAIHDWSNPGGNGAAPGNTNTQPSIGSPVTLPNGGLLTGSHKYGWLWFPATATTQGYIKFFIDGIQVGTACTYNQYSSATIPAIGQNIGNIIDQRHMSLIIGGIANTWQHVTSVTVWQASAAGNITS
jgi:Fibronectin type III domain